MNLWGIFPLLLTVVVLATLVLFLWTMWALWGYKVDAANINTAGKLFVKGSTWTYVALGVSHAMSLGLAAFVAFNYKKK